MEKLIKKINLLIGITTMALVFTCGITIGAVNMSNARLSTEEIEKSNIIDEIVKMDNVNQFFATTKMSKLFNLDLEKLQEIEKRGYTIYIVDTQSKSDLPEPIKVEGQKIKVSIYADDGALVDEINKLLASY